MSATPTYSERLGVPFRWWVQGIMLVASLWLAVVVATPAVVAWVVTALALAALGAGLGNYGAARIVVDDSSLRAGRAHIAAEHLGSAVALDAAETKRAAGIEADARAYLLLRPYLKRAVRVEITDPADPTPYWLISSRHPEDLARTLATLVERPRA